MASDSRPPRRPVMPGDRMFDEQASGDSDPAVVYEVAHRTAELLVRGLRASATSDTSPETVDRVRALASSPGLDELAALWGHSGPDSLPGALWRLYLLDAWVAADPGRVAEEYAAGCVNAQHAEVASVIAGVAEPPGPREVQQMIDQVLRGIATGDFDVVLERAAAFARLAAAGHAELAAGPASDREAGRLLDLSEELRQAARIERHDGLR